MLTDFQHSSANLLSSSKVIVKDATTLQNASLILCNICIKKVDINSPRVVQGSFRLL